MFDVSGKRAIITGGAQGFGRQFARRLLQKGCKVCITDIDENKGLNTKKEFQEQFGIKDNRLKPLLVKPIRLLHFQWMPQMNEAVSVADGATYPR